MEDLSLRDASGADVATIVAVIRLAFEEYRGRLDPASGAHEESAERVRQKMLAARVVLAETNGSVVGSTFYECRDNHVYLFRLAVLPAHRRRGIGRALVDYVENAALSAGLPRVRVGVRIALPQLRRYYERLGYCFVESGAHAGYSVPTYAILEKVLGRIEEADSAHEVTTKAPISA